MLIQSIKIALVLISLTFCCIALREICTLNSVEAQSPSLETAKNNDELKRLCTEDQADRNPTKSKPIDWSIVTPRDKERLKRVKELYAENAVETAADYDCAAIVLQHGDAAEDVLLAHELWVVAISKGMNDKDTLSLVAASEDRFLIKIGRAQRFGTQLHSEMNGPVQLYPVDSEVTDGLRRVMTGHSLQEIKARVVEMNKH
jgi:hypothetical protein